MEVVEFSKNKELFNKNLSTGVAFSSEANPEFLLALGKNTAIQNANLSLPLVVGNGQLTAAGSDKKFQFKGNRELVVQGGAEAAMRLGIFGEVDQLLKQLEKTDRLQLQLEAEKGFHYLMFSASYDLQAGAEGKWILNSGSLNASLSGAKSGRLTVIKAVKPTTGLKDAIKATLSEFKLPKHIKATEDISPGTYLITESYGGIKASFGAQLGYNFNWLFESELQGLEGTIGLRAKLGAQLGIGLDDAGEYALVLSRKDRKNRVGLQLFKQRKNGRSFAVALAASIKANLDDYKDIALDELIKATLGIHHAQILEDLKAIREWTDVDKLENNILGLTEGLVKTLVDAKGETFKKARKKVLDLLKAWEKLEQDATATLWQILDDKLAGNTDFKLSELASNFQRIANKDKPEIQTFLEEKLSRIGFEKTTFGKLLHAIVPAEDLIATLTESSLFKKLQKEAKNMADLLSLEDQITHFHATLSEELRLDHIKKAVQSAQLEDLGPLLSSKLFELITENGQFVLKKLEEIDRFIDGIREKSEVIFEKTKDALQKEYGISFALSLQRQKEGQAFIDASFTLGDSKINKVFKAALNGNYDSLLVGDHGGAIVLNQAILTHSVEKSKSISISLPFIQRDFSRINKAISTGKFIQEEDGKLLMYELDAEDTIRRSKKLSQLALEGLYSIKNTDGVYKLNNRSLYLSYNFRLAKKRFKTRHLEQLIEPFFKMYLPDAFKNNTQQPKISTDLWIRQMDDQIDAINHNGKNNFGTTMLNLALRVPPEIGAAWFKAPDKANNYEPVSFAIQKRLREILPLYFFENEDVFLKKVLQDELYALLTYEAILPQSEFKAQNNRFSRHWRWKNSQVLLQVLNDTETKINLARGIGRIKARLFFDPDPKMKELADKFDTTTSAQIMDILNQAATKDHAVNSHLRSLFGLEEKIIEATIKAGLLMAEFIRQADKSPKKALEELQNFGSFITNAFNKNSGFKIIASRRDYTRYLSAELFIAVAQALDPSVQSNTQGMFELLVLKQDADFDFKTYLDGELPDAEALIVSTRIFNFS